MIKSSTIATIKAMIKVPTRPVPILIPN